MHFESNGKQTYTAEEVNALLNFLKRGLRDQMEPLYAKVGEGGWSALSGEGFGKKDGVMLAMSAASNLQDMLTMGLLDEHIAAAVQQDREVAARYAEAQ